MKKVLLIVMVLFALPALLFIYQPSMQLGAFGLLLGFIGMTLSPIILFGSLFYVVKKEWCKDTKQSEVPHM